MKYLFVVLVITSLACSKSAKRQEKEKEKTNVQMPSKSDRDEDGLLRVGVNAPDFTLVDQGGKTHQLSTYRGKKIALYFYPKDNTPGCTQEARVFRDDQKRFVKNGIQVFGVSADSVESHRDFAKNQALNFPILSDNDEVVADAYGVPVRLGFASRITYLIDSRGRIAFVYPDVDPTNHAAEVYSRMQEID